MALQVDVSRYKFVHGKRPSGCARWSFKATVQGEPVVLRPPPVPELFSEAKRRVLKEARALGAAAVEVES